MSPDQARRRLARLLALGAVRAARAAQPSGEDATREGREEEATELELTRRAG